VETFEHFRRSDTVLLTTRRRDGRTVDTPVSFVVDDAGRGYLRTWPTSGKARRIANFPGVRLAPCSLNGRAQGSDQPALATEVTDPHEQAKAAALLAQRFPIMHRHLVPRLYRLRRRQTAFYRLEPTEEPTPWTGLSDVHA
jgi:hypothetical protein